MADNINPSYYQKSKFQVIDVIDEFTKDLTGIEAVDTGQVIKYISRWKYKNGLEDLKKAKWYLDHLIDHIEISSIKVNSKEEI